MDMSRYHELFISETREHLQKLSALAVQLEADSQDRGVIDALFRSAHSVKGMAASMGFTVVADLAHKMEDLMDGVRHGRKAVDAELFDLLLAGEKRLSAMLDRIAEGSGEEAADDLIARIDAYNNPEKDETASQPVQDEIITETVAASAEETPLETMPAGSTGLQTVKVKTAVLDRFLETTGELITVKHRLSMLARDLQHQGFAEAVDLLGRHLRDLHDQVMTVRLIPLGAITDRFPRMVRDLARVSGKEITFAIKGVEIEIDRSIIQLLVDPLTHLLRNSVDHGIETPAERNAAGKPETGRIEVSVSRVKDQVEIRIDDDGRGIDPERIAAKAVQKGFISPEKAAGLQADEKLMLICHAGFSTAERVTDISGRGVGMDVVKAAIQSLGGTISITSVPGKGSSFLLRLPLTIAIINVLLVKVGITTLAIPLMAVNRTFDLHPEEIIVLDDQEVLLLDDEAIPVFHLGDCLNIEPERGRGGTVPLFITEVKGSRVALQVDRMFGNQEIFVRPLGRPLSVIDGLSGITVLGNGEVVFVLDILNRFM